MALTTGARLGPYEIVSLLGAGGMGEVYLARDTRLNRMVAIKTLPADKLGDAGRKRRFIHEAQAASALNHPNIVTIYDIASEDGNDFLVMEYVRGKTMGQLIPPRGMRLDELLRYAVQTAEALTTAHAAGIVHRDLKPGNIMVTTGGHVKLLDFGLAKLTEPYQPAGEDARTRTLQADTDEGVIVGTTAFMSPEQVESKPVDARSDIFSFGAVLYEMATGVRAFKGDSKLSTLSAILRENPLPPSQVVPDVPRELDRIITRCLRKDPARRFQAMPDLKVALEELKEETSSGTAEMAVAKAAAPSLKRKSRLVLATLTAGVLAAGGASWFLLHRTSKPLPPRSVPLTTYAGSQGHPSFSPDGSQVAFEWNGEKQDNWDIYVKLVDGGAPLRLTTNAADDRSPAWSPDGRQIAFVRGGNALYSISPLGGAERKLTDLLARDPAWAPDGHSLLFSSAKSDNELYSIFQLSMDTGAVRRITSPPPQANPGDGDFDSAVSPDGRTLAFRRRVGLSVGAIYVQPLAGGETRRLTRITRQLYGIAWVNNREIVFGTGALGGGSLLRVGIDGRSEPEPVLAGLNGARNPAIVYPAKAPARLAYGRFVYDYNIWRMEIEPDPNGRVRTVTEPAAVISSTLADLAPQFSPDGQRIAFSSDRDGYREIWVGASDGSNQAQLTTLKSTRSGSPSWSPDGRQIALDSLASGNNDIWLVGSEGGLSKRLTTEPSNDARPSWSRDGRWIYFRSDRSGSQQVWKIPSSEPYTPAVQVTRNGAFEAKESLDGKLLYYVKTDPGLWSIPVEGGEETLVNESVMNSNWSLAASGVVFLDLKLSSPATGTPLHWFSFATGKVVQIGMIRKPVQIDSPSLSVTRDGRWIAWSQLDHQDSNLLMIENFR